MAGMCKCEANKDECVHSENCKRKNYDGDTMNFKAICNKENEYPWFKEMEESIAEIKE